MENFIKIFLYTLCLLNIHTNGNPLQGAGDYIEPAVDNEFPFLVSLAEAPANHPGYHFCGGTLISKTHILTATHCFVNRKTGLPFLDATKILVTIGSNDMTLGRKIGIDYWTTYEEWTKIPDTMEMSHDVSVAKLLEEVTEIAPAFISQCNHRQIRRHRIAVTAGWGQMNGGFRPKMLQKTTLDVIDRETCRLNFAGTNELESSILNHLCTTSEPRVVLGCGDSGGPLLINGNQLIAVNKGVCAEDVTHPNEQNSHQSVEYYRNFNEAFAERKAPCPVDCHMNDVD